MTQFTSNLRNLVERFTPLRRLGWAFLLAWVFCVFYLGIIGGRASVSALAESGAAFLPSMLSNLYYSCMPVGMSILMLVFIVAMEKRWGAPCQHETLFAIAPLATAFSTPLLFITTPNETANFILYAVGSVLTGFGSGFLWVMWGEYYARLSLEDVEFLAPVSAVIAALITLIMTAVQGWIGMALGVVFPLASGLCLWLSWQSRSVEDEKGQELLLVAGCRASDGGSAKPAQGFGEMLHAIGRTGFGILSACLFVCFVGGFWDGKDHPAIEVQVVLLVSIVFMLAVGLTSLAKPRRVSLTFLYRWMCPALVIGLAAIIIGGEAWGLCVAFAVSIAARFSFCLMTQMYFARYAMSGRITAVQSYGLGWIFVHLGDLLGVLAVVTVNQIVTDGVFSLSNACVVAIVLLVLAVMFVLNDDQSFAMYPEGLSNAYSAAAEEERTCIRAFETGDREDCSTSVTKTAEVIEGLPAGDSGLNAEVTTQSDSQSLRETRIAKLAAIHHLTPRETEVFALLAQGRSVPYIRDALVISKETAATHAKRIYAKLGVHSRQELIDLVQEGE